MERGGQLYYYHADGLGSITDLTDSSGNVVKAYVYDSFGNIVDEAGTLINPYVYTAREFDVESGLNYYRRRFYDPTIGRFLQEDPIPGFLSFPSSQNKYPYVFNNPINFTDPSGEIAGPIIGIIIRICGPRPQVCSALGGVLFKEILEKFEGKDVPSAQPPTKPIDFLPDVVDAFQDFINNNKVKPQPKSVGNCAPGKRMTSRGCRDIGDGPQVQTCPAQ